MNPMKLAASLQTATHLTRVFLKEDMTGVKLEHYKLRDKRSIPDAEDLVFRLEAHDTDWFGIETFLGSLESVIDSPFLVEAVRDAIGFSRQIPMPDINPVE